MDVPRSAHQRRRAAIVEAAGALFVAHGVADTAMDDIARRAGVSRATVFNHFPSKRELLLALYDRQLDRLEPLLPEPDDTADPLRQVARFFRVAEGVLREDGDLTPLLIREVLYDAELLAHDVDRGAAVRAKLQALVRAAQQRGQLRDDVSAATLTGIVMDLWTSALVPWVLAGRAYGLAARVMRHVRLVVRGLGPR